MLRLKLSFKILLLPYKLISTLPHYLNVLAQTIHYSFNFDTNKRFFFKDVIDESGSGEGGSGESGSDDGSTEEGSVEGESGDDNDGEIFKLTGFNF